MILLFAAQLASACSPLAPYVTPLTTEGFVPVNTAIAFEALGYDEPVVTLQSATGEVDLSDKVDRLCSADGWAPCLDLVSVSDGAPGDTVLVTHGHGYYETTTAIFTLEGEQTLLDLPTPSLAPGEIVRGERSDTCYTGPDVTINLQATIGPVDPGSHLMATATSTGQAARLWLNISEGTSDRVIYLESDETDCYTLSVIGPDGGRSSESNAICSHVESGEKLDGCSSVGSGAVWLGWLGLGLGLGRRRQR